MKRSISVSRKSKPPRGRPKNPGGPDPVSAVRLSQELTSEIDRWAEKHKLHRSEAIRRLVEIGLKVRKA